MNKKMAIELIEDFLILEYDYTIDTARKSIYEDISCIGLAHTENDEGVPIQISVNLEDYEIIVDVFGKDKQIKKYDSIDSLIENELMYLNFDELVEEFL